jgi:hypothetical protein
MTSKYGNDRRLKRIKYASTYHDKTIQTELPLTPFDLLILRYANDRLAISKGVQYNCKLFTF